MKRCLLIILATILICCQKSGIERNTSSKLEFTDSNNVSLKNESSDLIKSEPYLRNVEFIAWEEVRINGELPLVSNKEALFKLIGKPDSIVSPDIEEFCVSFYDKDFKWAYKKNSLIEIYGDTAVVTFIEFEEKSSIELTIPTLTLNRNTTLIGLGKIFPKAVKEKYKVEDSDMGKLEAVQLPPSKEPADDSWLLFFRNGKLVRLKYYMPC